MIGVCNMKRLRLNLKERTYMRAMGESALDLRYDYARRFRNAVLALTQADPHWMIWMDQNLPENGVITMRELLLVEARARAFVLRRHGWLGRSQVGFLLFRHDWAFTDRGDLSPG